MEIKFARIVSLIFHPLLIPTYVYFLMLNQESFYAYLLPAKAKWLIISLVLVTTCLLPLLFNLLLLKRGLIRSYVMETKEERLFPFLLTAIFFYLCTYMIRSYQLPNLFYLFSLGATMVVIIALLINFLMKISIHMTAIGGALGTFLGLSFKWELNFNTIIIAIILISGIIAYARIKLGAHRQIEIYTGFFLGLAVMFGLFTLI